MVGSSEKGTIEWGEQLRSEDVDEFGSESQFKLI
jgi:hypothetical protein